ncbi:Nonhistone chromosomal protein, putative [Perkinsus marinus ATCC 50983]|uniref:Nonhistone chromosomal protein, putative n=1 Tax=Perkinsus marinus (strain ATCC 50983 / TXsc) TaxID=423536 RepID=C5LHI2_PERM5|nr:Nonhistone chromosomal protein, putative [Perkinsus marinus ATCC 50983]EER03812.1 Nonhistone chromosomal protein, putative [Perkinsus marinus ATCC 50983]|eukprot:XP_002771996.1 Nonhistone chromosomal protein, putative [Perkinsus marinus ATCC 50983]
MAATKKASPKKATPTKVKKASKTKKDDGKPKVKRALSAYFFFMQKNRERIMKENGLQSRDIGELGRKMGEAWKGMKDNDKTPYEKLAAEDKKRYEREKKAVGL